MKPKVQLKAPKNINGWEKYRICPFCCELVQDGQECKKCGKTVERKKKHVKRRT